MCVKPHGAIKERGRRHLTQPKSPRIMALDEIDTRRESATSNKATA